MKRERLRWFDRGFVIPLAISLIAAGCAETMEAPEAPPPKVTVQRPERRTLTDYDQYNGWTRASETVEVRSRVRGHIKKVHFVDGDVVEKGALLFELDSRPFDAAISQAEGALGVDEAQKEFAAAEAARDTQLYEKKAISKAEYERTMAQLKTWEAKVDAAKEDVKRTKLDLEYSRITAEIPGRVSRAMLTEGNLVNAGGSDPVLTTVVKTDPIYVYFPVDEKTLLKYRETRAAKVAEERAKAKKQKSAAPNGESPPDEQNDEPEKPSDESKLETTPKDDAKKSPESLEERRNAVREAKIPFDFGLETEKGYPHQGTIDFADNKIDAGTGTIEVRGFASNADDIFVAGSRVRVQVPVSDPYSALVIPDVAILSDLDQRYVLVANTENVVVRRTVKLGRLLPDGMRVVFPSDKKEESLSDRDLVIVVGLQRARINYPVEPVDSDGKAVSRTK